MSGYKDGKEIYSITAPKSATLVSWLQLIIYPPATIEFAKIAVNDNSPSDQCAFIYLANSLKQADLF